MSLRRLCLKLPKPQAKRGLCWITSLANHNAGKMSTAEMAQRALGAAN